VMSTEQPSESPVIRKRLRWCVGKFVYVQGATNPMHFMELKRFIIDDAVDFSHLFYLRALRAQMPAEQQLDEALKKWMDQTAVKLLAEVVLTVLQADPAISTLAEIYPGVGLTGEYVQLLLEPRACQNGAAATLRLTDYCGCGPESERNKLMVLHAGQSYRVSYLDETMASAVPWIDPHTLIVLNHNQSLRYDHDPFIGVEQFLAARKGPAVIAVRCTAAEQDEPHTSVKGKLIQLPSQARIIDLCRRSGGPWSYRFLKGFDEGYLLPGGRAATGLLVAYRGLGAAVLRDFAPVS
jgi:hypothetical protein